MEIKKVAELRVLRHLQERSEIMIPDEMDENEFKAACYSLEKKNCVKLARIDGGFEAVRMLDDGLVYLKELEWEESDNKNELERLKNENAELKALSKNKGHGIFDDTREFVEATQYLYTIIMAEEFYDRNGVFYQDTKKRFAMYCKVNEDDLVKEVNNSPLQTYFDDYKQLLNSIIIPNKDILSMSRYIQENLTSDKDLLEEAIEIFEAVIEKCGNLRNSLERYMDLYKLKDNYPQKGFLRPLFIDEAIDEDLMPPLSDDGPSELDKLKEEWNKGMPKRFLMNLEKQGIITANGDAYDWKIDKEKGYSYRLYVYFVYHASRKLDWMLGKEKDRVPWKKFNPLFPNVTENQSSRNQDLIEIKKGEYPSLAWMIDEVLNME